MKTELCVVLLLSSLAMASCSGSFVDAYIGEATPVAVESVGAEFDPHFYSQNVTGRSSGMKKEDFGIIADRVTRMGLQKFRIMVMPQWFEPYNDNSDPYDTDFSGFRWDTVEMQSLYQVLDLAQKNGMPVCLVVWGCQRHVRMLESEYSDVDVCFLADTKANRNWVCPPKDPEEFGENFAALVKYLIEEKGYTCVNEITPFNEPGGDIIDPDGYVDVCKALDRHFRRFGIRDKVRFNLADNIDTQRYYLEACAERLQGVADILNSHTYIFGYESPNDTIISWEKANVAVAARAGLKHIVGEFGSNQCVGASRQRDIDTYLRGVLMTRLVLNFFNAGACAVSYWGLIDQYYSAHADYAQMQQLGLWRSVKKEYERDTTYARISCDYQCRPQFYAYSLLSRYVRPGAAVHPIETGSGFAAATAFENADGRWVYVFTNQEDSPLKIHLHDLAAKRFEIISYTEGSIPSDDSLIVPSGRLRRRGGSIRLTVPARSVVYCLQIQSPDEDKSN